MIVSDEDPTFQVITDLTCQVISDPDPYDLISVGSVRIRIQNTDKNP
jgi:hypothetical protein